MQTTLLGLGIAIILALVAALVGPHFVDWGQYRSAFEAQASRFAGMPVRIAGPIDARLLPVPSVTLRAIEVDEPAGGPRLRAKELDVALALGPLVRGTWRATELRIVGPEARLGLDAAGRPDWHALAPGFDPDSLSVDRFAVEGGRIALADAASGAELVLEDFSFNGDARSLAGPIKGEGSFTARGESHGYRFALGRFGDDGEAKLRFTVERAQSPLGIEVDGVLRFDDGMPKFDGSLALSRPAGVELVGGRAVASEPWRLTGKVKTSAAGALFEQVDASYGADDRALKLGGTAEWKFGARPRLDAVLSARQLDLDRFANLPDATGRLPVVVLRAAAGMMQATRMPALPVRLGVGVDAVMLGGAAVQSVRGDLRSNGDGWEIETLELRAPGFAQIRTSGRLGASAQGYSFRGSAIIEANDPKALAAWFEGRPAAVGALAAPMRASGEIAFTPERFAVERLTAEIDRKPLSGRLDYAWGSPAQPRPRLDADIKAAELDIDATVAFLRSAFPGADLDVPGELSLALDIGRATVSGVVARDTKAKLRLGVDGLVLERVAVGDVAGVGVTLNGRIEGPWTSPQGALAIELAGARVDGLAGLLAMVAPQPAGWLRANALRLAPAKLRLNLALDRSAGPSAVAGGTATLQIDGTAGALRLALNATARGDAAAWQKAQVRTEGRIETDDGRALARLARVDTLAAVGGGSGSLRWLATGPIESGLAVQGQLIASGIDVAANGTLAFRSGGFSPSVRTEISATIADATALRQPLGRANQPLPVALKAQLSVDGDRVVLSGISAKVADATLGGRLAVTLASPARVEGNIDADTLDLAGLVGAFAGAQARTPSAPPAPVVTGAGWSGEPFGAGFLDDVAGRVELTAARAALTPTLDIRQLRASLQLQPGEAALEDVEGTLGGGRVLAHLALQGGPLGTSASGRIAITDADLGALLPAASRNAVAGRVTLQLEAKGSGRSPAALIGALGGAGTVSLERLDIARLSPNTFPAAMRLADQGTEINVGKLRPAVESALDNGRIQVPRVDGALTVVGGQIRLGNTIARGGRVDLAGSGYLDLVRGQLDARLALLGPADSELSGAGRPQVDIALRGPFAEPQRSVDVSALVGWLTLRSVDQQAKRLEAAEAERRRAEEALRRANEEAARRAAEALALRREAEETAARRAAEEAAARAQSGEVEDQTPPATTGTAPPVSTPASAPAGPRRGSPSIELAPVLPPPVDIRPPPGARRSSGQRAGSQTSAAEREVGFRPPANIPPPAPRSMLDYFFRSTR